MRAFSVVTTKGKYVSYILAEYEAVPRKKDGILTWRNVQYHGKRHTRPHLCEKYLPAGGLFLPDIRHGSPVEEQMVDLSEGF